MSGQGRAPTGSRRRRVVLKISGNGFAQSGEQGISVDAVLQIARQIARVAQQGVQVAIVIGGGNILRGAQFTSDNSTVREATAHCMGMLATVLNGLALRDALASLGCDSRLMTAIRMDAVTEPYLCDRARRHLEKGRILVLAAGTGSPFVTTDTAAAQRALELEADVLLKATRVDGVFSGNPEEDPQAVLYDELSYDDVLQQDLRVMDHEAITKCKEHDVPILVFNFHKEGNIERAVRGDRVGTLIGRIREQSQ
ncbi:MAG: UMP kinase [Planctomycetes bacterium RBG_13_63_9]|nr:MAG: UMP kinase [Planctomycetes bacterium RBG_13_63_9]